MSHLTGVVYDSPDGNYPALAVIFRVDGDILVAHPVGSRAEGEAMLSQIMSSVQAQVDAMFAETDDPLEALEKLESSLRATG